MVVTDEMAEATAYTDELAKGDINDMQAVLRAAVISEKRRSRLISGSSLTDLERGRLGSVNSVRSSNPTGPAVYPRGYGPPSFIQQGYPNDGPSAPAPNYKDFAHLRKAQTAL